MFITFCNEYLPKSATQKSSGFVYGGQEQAETEEMAEHNNPVNNATLVKHGKVNPPIVDVLQSGITNTPMNEAQQVYIQSLPHPSLVRLQYNSNKARIPLFH